MKISLQIKTSLQVSLRYRKNFSLMSWSSATAYLPDVKVKIEPDIFKGHTQTCFFLFFKLNLESGKIIGPLSLVLDPTFGARNSSVSQQLNPGNN